MNQQNQQNQNKNTGENNKFRYTPSNHQSQQSDSSQNQSPRSQQQSQNKKHQSNTQFYYSSQQTPPYQPPPNQKKDQQDNNQIPQDENDSQYFQEEEEGQLSPNQAVVEMEDTVPFKFNPFQTGPQPNVVLQSTTSSGVPLKIERRDQSNQIKIEKPKKVPSQTIYVFNHVKSNKEELEKKFSSAANIEIIDPPNSILDDRPIIKLTFSDENSKNSFIQRNQSITSGFIRIFIACCESLEEAVRLRSEKRKKVENLMIRISGIPPNTSRSEVVRCIHQKYDLPLEYVELIENDDGSLICDVAVKNKNDFQRFLRMAPRVKISNISITADGYQDLMASQKE